jgi:hypothetical protein
MALLLHLGSALLAASGSLQYRDSTLALGGETIAVSAPLVVNAGGAVFSSADGSLKPSGKPATSSGTDGLGAFSETRTTWAAGATPLETAVRTYADCLVFELHWPHGASGTGGSGAAGGVIAGWPSLQLLNDAGSERGFLAFGGRQLENCFAAGVEQLSELPSGDGGGGPVAVFDRNGSTVVLSAASEFMSAAWARVARGNTTLSSGTLGTVTPLPAGFRSLTIAMAAAGPTAGVVAVGEKLQRLYGKNASASRELDPTLRTLGFSTDNGAYYYGKPEKGKDMEQTMIDMHTYSKQAKLPIQYALLDSWWYQQGKGGGVKNWTAQPRVFPDGMAFVHERTDWMFQLHNRYWATDNIYATQNGGEYNFIVEEDYAIPTEQKLWDDLMVQHETPGHVVLRPCLVENDHLPRQARDKYQETLI